MRKSKIASKLDKATYIGICILELSEVLMYEFHYDYIKNIFANNSILLLTDKLKMPMKILAVIKKYLISVIIHFSQNAMIIQTN